MARNAGGTPALPQACLTLESVEQATRIDSVRAAIAAAERCAGRAAGSVRLLAVSKTRPAAEVRAAYHAGLRHFGESYAQEGAAKAAALADLAITWHFVGAIQANKTRAIAKHFQWVHSVDRARIATRLNDAAARPLDVCVQVNVDAEAHKAGVSAAALGPLLGHIKTLPRLRLRGLMAIPAAAGDAAASFKRLRALFDAAHAGRDMPPCWDTLSMGMSADYPAAIAAGATVVRIGTAVFGPRPSARPEAV